MICLYILDKNLNFKDMYFGNVPRFLILHHAAINECSIEDIHISHLNRGWSGCIYNYFIKKDGTIFKGRDDNAIGSHCTNYNCKSLAICLEGDFNKEYVNKDQYKSLVSLIRYLAKKYSLYGIYGHSEVDSTNCPGINFPLEDVKREFINIIEEDKLSIKYPGYFLKYNRYFKDLNVLLIQKKLINLGYSLKTCGADGCFGIETLGAVKLFQRNNDLVIDGIVGKDTWNMLFG